MRFDHIMSVANVLALIFVVGLVAHYQNQSNARLEQLERVDALNAEREARNSVPIPVPEDALEEECLDPEPIPEEECQVPEELLEERRLALKELVEARRMEFLRGASQRH